MTYTDRRSLVAVYTDSGAFVMKLFPITGFTLTRHRTKIVTAVRVFVWASLIALALAPLQPLASHLSQDDEIGVGVFIDRDPEGFPDVMQQYAVDTLEVMKSMDACSAVFVTPGDIRNGALDSLDVIIIPGGDACRHMAALETDGADAVRNFIRNGGGYVGICAGAYLARTDASGAGGQVLNLVPAVLVDGGRYWDRGVGRVRISVTRDGRKCFPELKSHSPLSIEYFNGPVMIYHQPSGLPRYETLMTFASEMKGAHPLSAPMRGKPFMIRSRYGDGTVVLTSGHPERTPGLQWMLYRMVTLATGR